MKETSIDCLLLVSAEAWAHNPGMCPDLEPDLSLCGTTPSQPGHTRQGCFVLTQDHLDYALPFAFPYTFWNVLVNFFKNPPTSWGFDWDYFGSTDQFWGRVDSFLIMSLPIQEHCIYKFIFKVNYFLKFIVRLSK